MLGTEGAFRLVDTGFITAIEVGTDIESIDRFRGQESNIAFLRQFLNQREMEYCLEHDDPAPHLAGHFAAKEAIIKAGRDPRPARPFFKDIEIFHDQNGAPYAKADFGEPSNIKITLSISHCDRYALAVAVIYVLVNR